MVVIDFAKDNSASVRRRHQCCSETSRGCRLNISLESTSARQRSILFHESSSSKPQIKAVWSIGLLGVSRLTMLLLPISSSSYLALATATLMVVSNQEWSLTTH